MELRSKLFIGGSLLHTYIITLRFISLKLILLCCVGRRREEREQRGRIVLNAKREFQTIYRSFFDSRQVASFLERSRSSQRNQPTNLWLFAAV